MPLSQIPLFTHLYTNGVWEFPEEHFIKRIIEEEKLKERKTKRMCPHQESNLGQRGHNAVYSPLYYVGFRKSGIRTTIYSYIVINIRKVSMANATQLMQMHRVLTRDSTKESLDIVS